MQVTAGGLIKVTNTKDVVVLVSAYLEKTEPYSHIENQIRISPASVKEFFIREEVAPVLAREGDVITSRLIFEDVEGNVYKSRKLHFVSD